MQITMTPTCTETLREVQTKPALSGYEWMVTFQIDSDEGLSCALSTPIMAQSALEAQARVLRRVQEFLTAAAVVARDYQI